MNNQELTILFKKYLNDRITILLENSAHTLVGSLYLDGNSQEDVVVCNTENLSEKYFMCVPCSFGKIAIFFTYWRKLEKRED